MHESSQQRCCVQFRMDGMHVDFLYACLFTINTKYHFYRGWLINGATNGHGQWYCSLKIAGVEIGTLKHGTNLTIDTLDASPIYGQYINSATSALTIEVVASRHFGNQTLHFVSQGGSYKTTWFHIEEVAR